ncbi:MAG: hypothetical protein LBR89_01045 [Holosporales bacterium]|nr:hypothetical protein [Holosporales bacterium]
MVFANNTTFAYTVDASGLKNVKLRAWDSTISDAVTVESLTIKPGNAVECDFGRVSNSHAGADFGQIVVRRSEDARYMVSLGFDYSEPFTIWPALNGCPRLLEIIDKEKEFAVTLVYRQKWADKWKRRLVFSVETFEAGSKTYLDEYSIARQKQDELNRKSNSSGWCCEIF